MRSLDHKTVDWNRTARKAPISINMTHTKFENRERAKHLLKLKIASFLMAVLLIIKSRRITSKAKNAAKAVPKDMLEIEGLSERADAIEPIKQRINM